MNDKLIFQEAENTVRDCNQPYRLSDARVINSLSQIQSWQTDPQNDCLRARGDSRWLKSCEIATSLQALLEPF